jgi:hypothetical protein
LILLLDESPLAHTYTPSKDPKENNTSPLVIRTVYHICLVPSIAREAAVKDAFVALGVLVEYVKLSREGADTTHRGYGQVGVLAPPVACDYVTVCDIRCPIRPMSEKIRTGVVFGTIVHLRLRNVPETLSLEDVHRFMGTFGVILGLESPTVSDPTFTVKFQSYTDGVMAAHMIDTQVTMLDGARITAHIRVRTRMGIQQTTSTGTKTVYISNVPRAMQLSELHEAVGAHPLLYEWYPRNRTVIVRYPNETVARDAFRSIHGRTAHDVMLTAQYEKEYVELCIFHLGPDVTEDDIRSHCSERNLLERGILHVEKPRDGTSRITLKNHRDAVKIHSMLIGEYTFSVLADKRGRLEVAPRLRSSHSARRISKGHTVVVHNIAEGDYTSASLIALCQRYVLPGIGNPGDVLHAAIRPPVAFISFARVVSARSVMRGLALKEGLRVSTARHTHDTIVRGMCNHYIDMASASPDVTPIKSNLHNITNS